MSDLNLGVIGNGTFSGLIDQQGRIAWSCLPGLDGDPVFCSLLNGDAERAEEGFFDIRVDNFERSEQRYLPNTAILITTIYDKDGGAIEITDFAPRFRNHGRMFRPVMLVRQIRPVIGHPRIRIRLRPTHSYGGGKPDHFRGSNHIRYVTPEFSLRCTTDAPVAYVVDETAFVLEEAVTLFFGADESLTAPIGDTGREFFEQTLAYWREWSRHLAIPYEWQEAVIRAAITLKLSHFEETGGIVAAMTTSVPEAPNTQRNWDYRFCWLRDAYFVVRALNRLGATRTMESHMRYITNVAAQARDGHLQPVYGISLQQSLIETEVPHLSGYRGMGPVRRGNQAYEHVQNDVYGSVILAAAQAFFDIRLTRSGDLDAFERLESIGRRCIETFGKADAGLWEFRTIAQTHTYSSAMCWAGADRLAKIAAALGKDDRAKFWRQHADTMRATIIEKAFSSELNSFVDSFGGSNIDASLLLLAEIGFIDPKDPLFIGTVTAVKSHLLHGRHMFRYAAEDDFGRPETAFNICTFWMIDALAASGQRDEAREMFENMLAHRNHVGLFSEDIAPETAESWGNYPQTYSMVGLINSAMHLSESWKDAF